MMTKRFRTIPFYSIFVFLLAVSGVSGSSPSLPAAPPVVASPTLTAPELEDKKSNPIVAIGKYLKDSVVRLKDGTGQLYTNHKTCNAIRSKVKSYRLANPDYTLKNGYQKQGISYSEYDFLNKGKEERGKVLNIGFLMFFSPNFLPYAFMFFPNILPSTFQQNQAQESSGAVDGNSASPNLIMNYHKLSAISRERSHAVVKTLLQIENEALGALKTNPLNPFGRGKAKKNRLSMGNVRQTAEDFLELKSQNMLDSTENKYIVNDIKDVIQDNNSDPEEELYILNALQEEIFTTEEPKSKQLKFIDVPKAIIRGLSMAIDGNNASGNIEGKGASGGGSGDSFKNLLTPHFATRNKVVTHIRKVNDADEFIANEDIDLNDVTGNLLTEACQDRMIGTPLSSEDELRAGLSNWLDLTVTRPSKLAVPPTKKLSPGVMVVSTPTSTSSSFDDGSQSGSSEQQHKYYNGNLAKLALMCYNAVNSSRDTRSSSLLPRLLFQQNL